MIICKTHGENRILEEPLFQGLNEIKTGARLSNISHAIQSYVEANGFSIVREYVGDIVWKNLHEETYPYFRPPDNTPHTRPEMVLAIEPMVNAGSR